MPLLVSKLQQIGVRLLPALLVEQAYQGGAKALYTLNGITKNMRTRNTNQLLNSALEKVS